MASKKSDVTTGVPDEMVQAAAEALDLLPVSLHGWRHRAAEAALQAALKQLPECEAAENAVASRVIWKDHDHTPRPCCVAAILAALAREFGGQT